MKDESPISNKENQSSKLSKHLHEVNYLSIFIYVFAPLVNMLP